eukprot:27496-Pelagococcus_subviridis.AAC.2
MTPFPRRLHDRPLPRVPFRLPRAVVAARVVHPREVQDEAAVVVVAHRGVRGGGARRESDRIAFDSSRGEK